MDDAYAEERDAAELTRILDMQSRFNSLVDECVVEHRVSYPYVLAAVESEIARIRLELFRNIRRL